jgi:hypothetical protein
VTFGFVEVDDRWSENALQPAVDIMTSKPSIPDLLVRHLTVRARASQ